MTPSWEDLDARDLRQLAEASAREARTTVEAMFGHGKRTPQVEARRAFYGALDLMGWSASAIARFCGKDRTTVLWALDKKFVRLRVAESNVRCLGPGLAQGGLVEGQGGPQGALGELAQGEGLKEGAAGGTDAAGDHGTVFGGVHTEQCNVT